MSKKNILSKCTDVIENKEVILLIRILENEKKENHIFHPYATFFIQGEYILVGYSDKTEDMEAIPLSSIHQITQLSDVEFRDLKSDELGMLTRGVVNRENKAKVSHRNPSVAGMKAYWRAFDNYGKYKTGSRNQWYNEVTNIKFKDAVKSEFRVYFELCCQYGHQEQLIINIVIESRLENDNRINAVHAKFRKLDKQLKEARFDVAWDKRKGKKRRTIQLCLESLYKLDSDPQDPREHSKQSQHFQWFTEKLDGLCEVFDKHIELL
ncbi:MAG: hypothetical protein WD048_06085 [Chitinophagales bacterium]